MDAELKAAEKSIGRFVSLWDSFVKNPQHKTFVDVNYKTFRNMGDVIVRTIADMQELKKLDKNLDAAIKGGAMRKRDRK